MWPNRWTRHYSASEDGLAGYTASDWGGDCATDGSITLQPGKSKACSINNDDQPASLTVIKHVVNDHGGIATAAEFTMNVVGSGVSSPSFPGAELPGVTVTLDAGPYSVSEDGPIGYAAAYSDGCSGSIALAEILTCTITNTFQTGDLDVTKTVDWKGIASDPGQAFEICISGPSYVSGDCLTIVSVGGTLRWQNLIPGQYSVTETDPNPSGGWTVAISGSPATVTAGSSGTVPVTNTRNVGHLELEKSVPDTDFGQV